LANRAVNYLVPVSNPEGQQIMRPFRTPGRLNGRHAGLDEIGEHPVFLCSLPVSNGITCAPT
jgi:hypothetical protein